MKKTTLIALAVGGLFAICIVGYGVVDFIGGMSYFIPSPNRGRILRYTAQFSGFSLSGSSSTRFDSITLEKPLELASDFSIAIPSGKKVSLSDSKIWDELIKNGAEESRLGGETFLSASDLTFFFEDDRLTDVVARAPNYAISTSTSGGRWRLVYRDKKLQFPMEVREMRSLFGTSYRITSRY